MADFNPSFAFEAESDGEQDQAPWEFGGALSQAQQPFGTSVDSKIERQLVQRNAIHQRQQQQQGGGTRGASGARQAAAQLRPRSVEDGSSDEEASEESEDSADRPLPGEVDDSSDEEEQTAAVTGKGGNKRQPKGRDAAAAAPLPSSPHKRQRPDKPSTAPMDEEPESDADEDEDASGSGKRRRGDSAAGGATSRGRGGLFEAAPEGTSFAAQSFSDLNLSRPLVRACSALGYVHPTPIQAACVPLALTGRDISGSAVTGSGKTAAFALPLLERLLHRNKRVAATYVLVLAPTRELAVQVHSMIQKLAQFTDIQAALVVGGLSLQAQAAALKAAPEVVVATPGRLIDHLRNSQGFGLEDLACLVLDEADRLLEMGFAEEIREIVRMAPAKRQTMLFSATMTEEVRALAALSLRHPVRLAADAAAAAPDKLAQEVVRLKGAAAAQKEAALLALVSRSLATSGRAIVFFRTKQRAHRAKLVFGLAGLPPAAELHGDMSQAARLESLERFRKGEAAFLLATDVAARGLDIVGVETVVNYDCPRTLAAYLHRVGRTARAGERGRSISFVEDGDRALVKEVVKRGRAQLQQRALPAAPVAAWQSKLEGLEGEVYRIYQDEAEEKALRKAEMEAQKAANLMEHEDEIYARPKRTWFQSDADKKSAAERAKLAEGGAGAAAREPGAAGGSTKGKDKSAKRQERKAAAAKEAADAERKKGRGKLMEETAAVTGQIRKAKAREAALRMEGVPASQAGRIAAAQAAGIKKKAKPKKKAAAEAQDGPRGGGRTADGLFAGDGVTQGGPAGAAALGGNTTVYSGGARSGKPKKPPSANTLSGVALSRVKRGGKGKSTIKSKSKHKRRH